MGIFLFLLVLQPLSEQGGFSAGAGFFGYGGADLDSGLNTLGVDSLLLLPSVSVFGDGYRMNAVAQASPVNDGSAFTVLHASGGLRLPGSPWIGAEAAYGADSPFLFSLDRPWREWDNSSRDSLLCAAVEGGGVLGFDGFYRVYREGSADTLVWTGIRSPWLGFAQVWWDGFRGPVEMNALSGMVRLGNFVPWFSYCDSSGVVRGDAELRGKWARLPASLSLVPWVHYSNDDSTQAGLKVHLSGSPAAHSGLLRLGFPLQGEGSFSGMLRYYMQSAAGIHWSTGADASGEGNWDCFVFGEYRASPAGFGMGVSASQDSVRVTGRSTYSPVPSVSASLELSSDVFSESADPSGKIRVSAFRGPVTALLGYSWSEGTSLFSIELGGWLGI
ncbi:MAG: hypothetical protein R6V62_08625 [Candidatus Fermentibacteraceae bacterium]